jgi:F-type H+-transporting ATPase subunit alpha
MAIKPEEVSSILQREIEGYQSDLSMKSIGTVLSVGDGIARVYGLDEVMAGEMVEFSNKVNGIALNLEESNLA